MIVYLFSIMGRTETPAVSSRLVLHHGATTSASKVVFICICFVCLRQDHTVYPQLAWNSDLPASKMFLKRLMVVPLSFLIYMFTDPVQ